MGYNGLSYQKLSLNPTHNNARTRLPVRTRSTVVREDVCSSTRKTTEYASKPSRDTRVFRQVQVAPSIGLKSFPTVPSFAHRLVATVRTDVLAIATSISGASRITVIKGITRCPLQYNESLALTRSDAITRVVLLIKKLNKSCKTIILPILRALVAQGVYTTFHTQHKCDR